MYHSILIDASFARDNFVTDNFTILKQRKSSSNPWNIFLVEIGDTDLEIAINLIQTNLKTDKSYYAHIYNDEKLVVIFKEKVFNITPDKSTWKEVVSYGVSRGIPIEQMDIKPYKFIDEDNCF